MRLLLIINQAVLMCLLFWNNSAQCHETPKNLEQGSEPRIFCEEPTFDFGSRDSSEIVEHEFILKNTGTADLEIRRVQPACGCTTAELEKKIIPPGEDAKIAAKLSLAGRIGELAKPIVVDSNDPTNPTLQLMMKGVAGTDFEITPSTMVLRKDSPQEPSTASVIVKSLKNEKFEILRANSEGGKLQVRWDKFPDEFSYQITANLADRLEPGQYADKITLETNHPTRKQLEISVIVVVPTPIAVAPSKIVLGPKSQAPVSRTIILKNPSNDSLTIEKIETHDPAITYTTEKMGDFGVKLKLGNIIPSPSLIGQSVRIVLATGQEVRIPFELKERE